MLEGQRPRGVTPRQGRGSGRECQAAMAQEWPIGATPRPRSGEAAERSYPESEVRGGGPKELPPHRYRPINLNHFPRPLPNPREVFC